MEKKVLRGDMRFHFRRGISPPPSVEGFFNCISGPSSHLGVPLNWVSVQGPVRFDAAGDRFPTLHYFQYRRESRGTWVQNAYY